MVASLYREITCLREPAICINFSPEGKLLCATSGDRYARIFQTITGTLLFKLTLDQGKKYIFRSCNFLDELSLYALETETKGNTYLSIWKIEEKNDGNSSKDVIAPSRSQELKISTSCITCICYSEISNEIACGTIDGYIKRISIP